MRNRHWRCCRPFSRPYRCANGPAGTEVPRGDLTEGKIMEKEEVLPYYRDLLTRRDLEVRPAVSRRELEEAYRLVYDTYLDRGYIQRSESRVRMSVYNALPETVTFVAVTPLELVMASATLIRDTEIGLPMEDIYSSELQELRDAGRRLVEFGMLAHRRRDNPHRPIPLLMLLMKRLFDYAWFVVEADDICIAVHPRHADFYQKVMFFKPLGPSKNYPAVQNNPAVAMRLDLREVKDKCRGDRRLWQTFFTDRTPPLLLSEVYEPNIVDLRHFFIDLKPVFAQASPRQLKALKKRYPHCPWNVWERSWKTAPDEMVDIAELTGRGEGFRGSGKTRA